MAVASSSKGKKRAYVEERADSSSLSPVPDEPPKVKKPKRAETRKCPVCDELIPLRLLAAHSALESERVEAIIKQVGNTEALDEEPDEGPGPSSRSRRSAVKARKSLSAMNPGGSNGVLQQAGKTIQTIKRHRKQRHAKFREMTREEEELNGRVHRARSIGEEIVCPVCLGTVRGDQDVVDAHVDACLANENRRLDEERQRALEQQRIAEGEVWEDPPDGAAGHVGNVRGTGFHMRNQNDQDVDDELDVDGDEGFGEPQFTEGDILPVNPSRGEVDEDIEVEIEGDDEDGAQREQKTLRDLVAEGKVVRKASGNDVDEVKAKMEEVMGLGDTEKMDLALLAARKRGDKASLITALENKVKQLEAMRVSSLDRLLAHLLS
ncbi:putative E3 ubiquitin-protein ligase RNF220 [Lyophyllum shimeji]|uniref:E3 ubiquitin-protein ligase RNF220 n=1 Tax=Lyophyllum shimeji TaxID=47721 RepID=A0A9P3PDJ3_LYOSH|nr:putative E3 ubiquitin-protein ligase RNF220 [Lyophyllum shimeji]